MKITFIGGGNMAGAMIGGLLAKGWVPADICVVEILDEARNRLKQRFGVICFDDSAGASLAKSDVVVFAVKPQQMHDVAVQVGPTLRPGQIVLSIAAGVRLGDLSGWLQRQDCVMVRAMPNMPALIGEGITALYSFPPKNILSPADIGIVEAVTGAVGDFVWVLDENQMDAVTAVSGSGPAYVFWFIEHLASIGEHLGLPAPISKELALKTVLGAAKLASQSGETPSILRERVTSKGGTTEAALKVFEEERLAERFRRAVEAACKRSAELGEELAKD